MSIPFFLTRQTANLMEDFARELNQGSALFLLYGDSGVGKTRLLQELGKSRLSERTIHWLDLDSGDGSDDTRMDLSTEIDALFAAAGKGDIIIVDQFESVLKKCRHQLLLNWSTDGIDKQLYLIIASNTEGYNELAQLAQKYQVKVQSSQLLPFSADEVQAFLGFYLYPDNPSGKLTIPSPLTRQLAAAQGLVGRVVDIVDREASQIQSAAAPTKTSRRGGRNMVAVVLLLVLVLGAGWFLFDYSYTDTSQEFVNTELMGDVVQQTPPESVAQAVSSSSPEVTPEPESIPAASTGSEAENMAAAVSSETGVDSAPAIVTEDAFASALSKIRAETFEDIGKLTAVAMPEAVAQERPTLEAEPGTASDSEAVIDDSIVESLPPPPTPAANEAVLAAAEPMSVSRQERFQIELKQSLDWLDQHDDRVGTIQILLLTYSNFDVDNYFKFVDGLTQRGVDADQLHVFKAYTGNREVYSVVYGEYPSRRSAMRKFGSLPEVLKETSPLGRSVGGLRQEIRRLKEKN